MELRHMRYFVAVAENLSFRRAAQQLRIAQPALSSQIRDLETELGVKLFERSTRSVRLTMPGQVFLKEAMAVLAGAALAEQNVRRANQGVIGTLKIGLLAPLATQKLARVLNSFRKQNPNVQFLLSELTSIEQIHRLQEDKLDVGFVRPLSRPAELEFQNLEEAAMVLAAPAGHRLMGIKELKWSDFDGEQLVLVHPNLQHGFYDRFLELCKANGAEPVVGQYANDINAKMWLISAGFGIAPTMASLAEVKRPGLSYRKLPPGLPMLETVVAWKRGNNSPILKNFLQFFSKQS